MPVRTWPGTIQCPGHGLTLFVFISTNIDNHDMVRFRLVCNWFQATGGGLPVWTS